MQQSRVKTIDDVNGDGTIIITSSSSPPSSRGRRQRKKAFGLQTSLIAPQTLIDELAELGFDAAADFVMRFEPERIRRAIDRAKSLENVRNVPGFIRYSVTKPGPIPAPEKQKDGRAKYEAHAHLYNRKGEKP
jgi:hypothetical protein